MLLFLSNLLLFFIFIFTDIFIKYYVINDLCALQGNNFSWAAVRRRPQCLHLKPVLNVAII